jgi:hypothetical protein
MAMLAPRLAFARVAQILGVIGQLPLVVDLIGRLHPARGQAVRAKRVGQQKGALKAGKALHP